MSITDTPAFEAPTSEHPVAYWGANTPKGARAVPSRIVKEGANVPLFLGQTLINALRDPGYSDTTSAVCEHVDNAVQWGAPERGVKTSASTCSSMTTGAAWPRTS